MDPVIHNRSNNSQLFLVPDGTTVSRNVPDEGVAQDPEVRAAEAGEASQVVERLQRFPAALPRQGSEPATNHGSFAQSKWWAEAAAL